MRKPTYVEAFPEFQALGRGAPFLAIWKNRKTAHIDWHAGSLWDYAKFEEAIDGETMSAELEAPGNATCRRTAPECAPSSTEERAAERAASRMRWAEAFWNIVKRHYTQALKETATAATGRAE